MLTAESIAHALGGRRSGARWMVCCPAHKDSSPSCSIRENEGRILVHCFAGCRQEDVIAALRGRGLWPEAPKRERSPAERRSWGLKRRAAEGLAGLVAAWFRIRELHLESKKRLAYEAWNAGRGEWFWTWVATSEQLHTLQVASLLERVQLFRQNRKAAPAEVGQLIAEGRRLYAEDYRFIRWVVTMLHQKSD